MALKMQLARS